MQLRQWRCYNPLKSQYQKIKALLEKTQGLFDQTQGLFDQTQGLFDQTQGQDSQIAPLILLKDLMITPTYPHIQQLKCQQISPKHFVLPSELVGL